MLAQMLCVNVLCVFQNILPDLLIVGIVDDLFFLVHVNETPIFYCRNIKLPVGFSDYFLIVFITERTLRCGWFFMTPKTMTHASEGESWCTSATLSVPWEHYTRTLGRISMDCSYIKCEIIYVLRLNSASISVNTDEERNTKTL